jgi:hypothetical protein
VQLDSPTRRRQATSRDDSVAPYKRGATGSNPVAPTRYSDLPLCAGRLSVGRSTALGELILDALPVINVEVSYFYLALDD